MSPVRYTHQAREDLLDIWSALAERASEAVADRIYDHIEEVCGLLKAHPQLGRARAEIHPDARAIVIERWLALYRVTGDSVQIVRVIDGARDLSLVEWAPK
ncbi:plasmid stabilization protein [Rhodoblastus sphagnicola]|uniref:Plasmid stabilization protein n=1 Tax=Rhodoblastus sphagnicola TaxID=333368 RepID=A0A2S6NEE8_9HYPH|nr:type II toxin-antitoxin system RelE/ParE family toxin [Rhodoblastus sphagnicola]MBB4200173.1 toxin ParE1/3/4 [Rhodoblastus sphagnicola]PPQ32983.1 plasmid stabilization protein [Rhodoblastus sphagnicola]